MPVLGGREGLFFKQVNRNYLKLPNNRGYCSDNDQCESEKQLSEKPIIFQKLLANKKYSISLRPHKRENHASIAQLVRASDC